MSRAPWGRQVSRRVQLVRWLAEQVVEHDAGEIYRNSGLYGQVAFDVVWRDLLALRREGKLTYRRAPSGAYFYRAATAPGIGIEREADHG